ncbi:YlxR family protein [Isoptericola jiangsuensis]|uniref:YlxR family protein n=1 Tax=Isoptericola jiangsuensis TaxID=548579 RepID=UPI003AAAF78F
MSWSSDVSEQVRLTGTGPRAQDPACPRPLPASSAGPVRTCVGCRGRDLRSELLRLVLATSDGDQLVVVDERGSRPGRGAWIHPDARCLALAVRRRAVPRALRADGPLDLSAVRTLLEPDDR